MKKSYWLLVIGLLVIIAAAVGGCGSGSSSETTTTTVTTTTTIATTTTESTTTTGTPTTSTTTTTLMGIGGSIINYAGSAETIYLALFTAADQELATIEGQSASQTTYFMQIAVPSSYLILAIDWPPGISPVAGNYIGATGWDGTAETTVSNAISDAMLNAVSVEVSGGESIDITMHRVVADPAVDWTEQDSGLGTNLTGVSFVDADNGWAVSNFGDIINTSDGGENWSGQVLGNGDSLSAVSFTDALNGWAAGNSGLILHTTDGGTSWSSQDCGTTNAIQNIFFVGLNGWLCTNGNPNILLSTDSGATWTAPVDASPFPGAALRALYVADATHAWFGGESLTPTSVAFIKTTDGGATLSNISIATGSRMISSLHFSGSTGYGAGSTGLIIKSVDEGDTWVTLESGTTSDLYAVSFISSIEGWVAGDNGEVLYTADGGGTWTQQSGIDGSFNARAICMIDATTGWLVGDNGKIYKKN